MGKHQENKFWSLSRNIRDVVGGMLILNMLGLAATASSDTLETVVQSADFAINGVAVTRDGRVFVSMPQWTSVPSPSVGEVLAGGVLTPYPGNDWNRFDADLAFDRFTNVNAVHADGVGSLWVVDYAAPQFGPVIVGAQKLVQIDLASNEIVRVYRFDKDVLPDGAKLNDVRVNAKTGTAYISEFGLGAIIVVDLQSGDAFRALDQHSSTRAHPDVVSSFLGEEFRPNHLQVNDIELSADGETLYYQPTGGPVMWQIPTKAIAAPAPNADLEPLIQVVGKTMTIGGVSRAPNGHLMLGSVQDNTVWSLDPETGEKTALIQDDRLLWPDTMSVGPDGYLYIPAPQLRLLPKFNNGQSKVIGEFSVYRMKLPTSYQ
ncbi:L-dopachrome tautomerase-related protein [Parasedimentitalea psychrophila]|uniref:L-dopachrome tautomerase-related protein n=1 Tax=Parasedimentitalea psychrophila TaxID=2997337 RepID=A0A9Y2L4F8_9RHOB|nr:L-dopachrome tautomerase-related protein [Parasedimentitalea psychrophila]WIY27789.1 L-dopachrome tautomerase-related protein [Parasedimentitalea psychrophila]